MFERERVGTLPVTLAELKSWNYIQDDIYNDKLNVCLRSAIAAVESHINSVVWKSTFALSFDHMEYIIPVEIAPVESIVITVDGEALQDSLYRFDGDVIAIDRSVEGSLMAVSIVAGKDAIDDDIKSAVLLMASELFRNPTDSVKQLPTASQLLLQPHRRANI